MEVGKQLNMFSWTPKPSGLVCVEQQKNTIRFALEILNAYLLRSLSHNHSFAQISTRGERSMKTTYFDGTTTITYVFVPDSASNSL